MNDSPLSGGAHARPARRPPAADGFVVVDKPQGWTSHDVVARMRGLASTRKVGHAGTLDPMATGVLVLGIGRATKLLTYVVGEDKEYRATVRLGASTTTDDAEGEVLVTGDVSGVTDEAVRASVTELTGAILQVPSAVSAVKVDGKRAYARVRAGETVELTSRPVTISRFDVEDVRRETHDGSAVVDVDVTVVCSSGTYVRALARDMGVALGCGGHLTALRRTRVGGYTVSGARTLEDLAAEVERDGTVHVMPLADAARARFPVRDLTDDETRDLGHGRRLTSSCPTETVTVAAVSAGGTLVALLEDDGEHARPVLVFAPAQ
ncbi:tRNA pseudouridine(55) synthase TruB [Sanguibacter antarcticus]|uniref:tRNA pseudouridine synthase B n=1 Tax=Sanguibacter antarcticus TaxID=372484 RepID=A0A2A9E5S1_9MICO|nr:tRNA pseudouridine(55) synthase TruB [Sanguibacter antarcticus]PFG33529.1 tRNA pseudouridine synthase B [Sanguibacter antarcticus]